MSSVATPAAAPPNASTMLYYFNGVSLLLAPLRPMQVRFAQHQTQPWPPVVTPGDRRCL